MIDKFGNSITKTKKKKGTYYHLILQGEQYPRSLGYMDNDGFFQITRDPDKHYHYKTGGYGFNYQLITSILDKKTPIVLSLKGSKQKFLLRPEWILENKENVLNFTKQGFEVQVFVRFKKIQEHLYMSKQGLEAILKEKDKIEFLEEISDELDSIELWNTPARDLSFRELKEIAISIRQSYDNTYGYVDEKINRIKDLENIGSNFMLMFNMFDIHNKYLVMLQASERLREELNIRINEEKNVLNSNDI